MMKHQKIVLITGLCMLGACSSTQTGPQAALSVEPVLRITDASGTPHAQYRLGRYYQGQNRLEQAIAAYRRTLEMDANYSEAHNALGVLYSRQQQYPEAIAEFKAALTSAPDAAYVQNNLGYTYYLQGDYDKAVVSLKQALALDAGNARAQNNLALAYAQLGSDKATIAEAMPDVPSAQNVVTLSVPEPEAVMTADAAGTTARDATEPHEVLQTSRGVIVRETAPLNVVLVQSSPRVYALQRTNYQEAVPVSASQQLPKVEISNGNGIEGLARRIGSFLQESGYPGARLTNQKPFNVGISQIQYRQGYEAEAQSLRDSVPGQPTLVQADNLRSDIKLRLLLGKDFSAPQAVFANAGKRPSRS